MQSNKETIGFLRLCMSAWATLFSGKIKSFLSILIFLSCQSSAEGIDFNGQQNSQQQRLNLIIASQNSSKAASNLLSGTFPGALPSIQKAGSNSVLNAAIASEIVDNEQTEIIIVGSLSVAGNVTLSGNTMTIALPTNINELVISDGVVTLKIPTAGTLAITVDGSVYTDPIPGLIVEKSLAANTFEIDGAVVLSQGFWSQTGATVSIGKSFSVTTDFSSAAYISLDSASVFTVQEDITLNGVDVGSVNISGDLSSTAGNILFRNNQTTNNVPGVLIGGSVLTSSSNSLSFIDNSSSQNDGVLIDTAAKIQSGTVTFTGNFGNDFNYGINIKGNVYTNQFNATKNCTTNNQELHLDHDIYQYSNPPAVPLSESQINIVNIGCGGGTLTMTGSVAVSGDIMTIALPTIGDIVITDDVVIKVPTSGSLAITVDGSVYTDPIPGLTIVSDQATNTFEVRGSLLVTAPSTGGIYANVAIGVTLTVSGALTFNGGPDEFTRYGSVFNAGTISVRGDITMSYNQGATFRAGIENRGNITTNSGDIKMNYNWGGFRGGAGVGGASGNSAHSGPGGAITATLGNITMNYNTGGASEQLDGCGAAIGGGGGRGSGDDVGGGGSNITAISGSIIMSGNTGGNASNTGGAGAGIGGGGGGGGSAANRNGGLGGIIIATTGDISNNTGGAGAGFGGAGAGFGGGGGAGGVGGVGAGSAGGAGTTYSVTITIGANTGGIATGGGSNGAGNGVGGNGASGGAGGAAYSAV